MKLLLVGFEGLNSPTKLVANELKEKLEIDILLLSNNYKVINKQLNNVMGNDYEAMLIVGQKKGSKGVTLERVALNVDNKNQLIINDGDVGYFSTLPLTKIYDGLKKEKISVRYSNNAGHKYCNCAFYNLMYLVKENNLEVRAGLIHIPDKNKIYDVEKLCQMVKAVIKEL